MASTRHETSLGVMQACSARLASSAAENPTEIVKTLNTLASVPVTVSLLKKTGVAKVINSRALLRHPQLEVRQKSSELVANWREVVRAAAQGQPAAHQHQNKAASTKTTASHAEERPTKRRKETVRSSATPKGVVKRQGMSTLPVPIPGEGVKEGGQAATSGPAPGPVARPRAAEVCSASAPDRSGKSEIFRARDADVCRTPGASTPPPKSQRSGPDSEQKSHRLRSSRSAGSIPSVSVNEASKSGGGQADAVKVGGSTTSQPRVNMVDIFSQSVPQHSGGGGRSGHNNKYFCFDNFKGGNCTRGESCPFPHFTG